jgi:uncharacterized protein YjbI with pentapeptide repeats
MVELDRLVPEVVAAGHGGVATVDSNHAARIERVIVTLDELMKFIPDGSECVPASAHRDESGIADQAARPERYERAWIASMQAQWRRFAADLARASLRRAVREVVGAAVLDAHHDWVARGRVGAGQLELVGTDLGGSDLIGEDLAGARFHRVRFAGSRLDYVQLAGAELIDCDFRGAWLHVARLDRARFTNCDFEGALLGLASCDGTRIARCRLERAWMDRSSWRGAVIEASRLRHAQLAEAHLDGARFIACDLRAAELFTKDARFAATTRDARFDHCDLRAADFTGRDLAGVTFRACKFATAHGQPSSTRGWTVVDADFSEAGDGSELGDATDLLDQLR